MGLNEDEIKTIRGFEDSLDDLVSRYETHIPLSEIYSSLRWKTDRLKDKLPRRGKRKTF